MQTLKIKYHTTQQQLDKIKQYQKQYTNLLRWMYNRVREGVPEKQREQQSKNLNNLSLLDSWFIRSAAKQAQWINDTNKDKIVVFGGRKNLIRRTKGLITKEEYQAKRLQPIQSIGETVKKGNRKFRISSNIDKIIFTPNRYEFFDIIFDGLGKNYRKIIERLYIAQEAKSIPITYQLSQEYVYIMFDEKQLHSSIETKKIKNRIIAIDLNPNYIGWSIVDWKSSNEFKVIKHGVYSIKQITDKENDLIQQHLPSDDHRRVYISNKRYHEVMEISKNLINKALYYQCEMFSVEDLNIKNQDNDKGKKYNRLVNNQWCRNKLLLNLEKRCNIFGIKMIKVIPSYSSFIGNVVFRGLRLSDMELASVEIGRRGYELNKQYIEKIEKQKNNIIFPNYEDFKEMITKSLEEFGLNFGSGGLKDLYYEIKKSKFRYRLSLDDVEHPMFSSCFSKCALILKYNN